VVVVKAMFCAVTVTTLAFGSVDAAGADGALLAEANSLFQQSGYGVAPAAG
jgi:hypothetical protein